MKRSVLWTLGVSYVTISLALMGPAVAETSARQDQSGQSGSSGLTVGQQVYSRNCAACHGADGKGKTGPRLVGTSLSSDAIEKKVTNGGTQMPAFKDRLSPTEIKAVAAYVRSLGGGS